MLYKNINSKSGIKKLVDTKDVFEQQSENIVYFYRSDSIVHFDIHNACQHSKYESIKQKKARAVIKGYCAGLKILGTQVRTLSKA